MDTYNLNIDATVTVKVRVYSGSITGDTTAGEVMRMEKELQDKLEQTIADALMNWNVQSIELTNSDFNWH